MKQTRQRSYRAILSAFMLICWMLPIAIITLTASNLLNQNYNRSLRRRAQYELEYAVNQVGNMLQETMADSWAIFEGNALNAEDPQRFDHAVQLLNHAFARNSGYEAVYLCFPGDDEDCLPYIAALETENPEEFRRTILPQIPVTPGEFVFLPLGDDLYLNYTTAEEGAVLSVRLDLEHLLKPLEEFSWDRELNLTIDGIPIPLELTPVPDITPFRIAEISCSAQVAGHSLVCQGEITGMNVWMTLSVLRRTVLFVASLVIPMLLLIVFMFNRNINRPTQILLDAYQQLLEGQRGYKITERPPNREFEMLFHSFNTMSCQMECQFRQLYEEQQALQQAKIKALQSQINPHFLNNTLEVINWEARLAENERVCDMLEAMTTMLDAAIGRDGRSQVLLSEELKYVEAYLHIIQQRLGDRLTLTRDIQPEALNWTVPLLTLQPVLENAVEYDLSHTGGELALRAFVLCGMLHLEVEHDGIIDEAGWQKIHVGLSADAQTAVDGRSVGIRNVVNRLMLIYGSNFRVDIRQTRPGRILAEIILPEKRPS